MAGTDIKQRVITTLSECGPMPRFRLKQMLPSKDREAFDDVFLELCQKGEVRLTPTGISLQPTTLDGYLQSALTPDELSSALRYLRGEPMPKAERETVRQQTRNALRNRPEFAEDRLKFLYRRYSFPREVFVRLFGCSSESYGYIKETTSKGRIDWREIRKDEKISLEERENALELVKEKGIWMDDELVDCSPAGILVKLAKIASTSILEDDLWRKYLDFIKAEAPVPKCLQITQAKAIALIRANADIMRPDNKCVRYRKSSARKDIAFIRKLKLHRYKGQCISADVIFSQNASLAADAGIINGNELYWILKEHADLLDPFDVAFSICPMLTFGKGTHGAQLLALMREMSPVSGDDLAEAYQARYGLRASTVKMNYLRLLSKFNIYGVYDAKARPLSSKQFERLKRSLRRKWYFKEEIEKLFKGVIGENYRLYFSLQSLSALGYRVTNGFVYSNEFSSVTKCFESEFLKQPTFTVDDRLWKDHQIYLMLTDNAEKFEIVEYSPQKYITIKALKEHDVHKKDLRAYMDAVCSFVTDESYFTLTSIANAGFTSPLDELGFDDTFYYSILKQSKKINGKAVAGKHIFRKSKEDATLHDFLEYIVSDTGSIDIYDLTMLLFEKYGMDIEAAYIKMLVKPTSLYYDKISEKVFPDYETYIKEI